MLLSLVVFISCSLGMLYMPALPKFAGFSRACAAACLASDGLTVPVQQDMAGGHEVVCYVLIISGNIVQVALLVCHDLIHQASVTFNIKILNIYVKRFEDLCKFFFFFAKTGTTPITFNILGVWYPPWLEAAKSSKNIYIELLL